MKRVLFLLYLFVLWSASPLFSQEDAEGALSSNKAPTPKDMWEIGVHGGHVFVAGDVGFKPGYGGGISVRKATDYLFSLRADLMAGFAKGENSSGGEQYKNNWYSGSVLGVISINAMKWDKPIKKTNLYGMLGGGANYFEVLNQRDRPLVERELAFQLEGGAGISIRINEKFNVGVEHKSFLLLGNRTDRLDARRFTMGQNSPSRDIFNYTCIKVNVNIGSKNKSEPLYWVNPLDVVLEDVSKLKQRAPSGSVADADQDGVIDAVDLEPNTDPNARVDTKGRTLDSDNDGLPDHKDKEPYSPPGVVINEEGVAEKQIFIAPEGADGAVQGVAAISEAQVRQIVREEIGNTDFSSVGGGPGGAIPGGGGGSLGDIFLPMIHFSSDSHTIKYSDYGTLASIARLIQNNPGVNLVIIGFADQSSTEEYNTKLSYERALSVIDHLVERHSVERERLILNYKGESDALNSPSGSTYMNRRVEFKVASSETEMPPPDQINTNPRVTPTGY